MSFESIELDFDDSEGKSSEENSDGSSISNDLISRGIAELYKGFRIPGFCLQGSLNISIKVVLSALCGLLHQNISKTKF